MKNSTKTKLNEQQILDNWKPPNMVLGASLLLLGSVYLFIVGIVFAVWNKDIVDSLVRYDDQCPTFGVTCDIRLEIEKKMKPPIYLYYELHNFNQNTKVYMDSYDEAQVFNQKDKDPSKCEPFVTNGQMGKTLSTTAAALNANDVAIPCGLRAYTFFEDSYTIKKPDNISPVPIDETNISWDYDKEHYKNIDLSKQWIDLTNEHFQVWMRPAALSKFRKLWGRIHEELQPGNYYVAINNKFDTQKFNSKKYIYLTTKSDMGGDNTVQIITHFFIGAIMLISSIVMFIIHFQRLLRKKK